MITLLIGIAIAVLVIIYFAHNYQTADGISIAILLLGFTVLLSGIPLQGFEAPTLYEEKELLQLKDVSETENVYFVDEYNSTDGTLFLKYAYDNSKIYDIDHIFYEEKSVAWKYSKIFESKDCSKPILKVFVIKPKKGLFTFDILKIREYEYVFYVPEGTVIKNIGG